MDTNRANPIGGFEKNRQANRMEAGTGWDKARKQRSHSCGLVSIRGFPLLEFTFHV